MPFTNSPSLSAMSMSVGVLAFIFFSGGGGVEEERQVTAEYGRLARMDMVEAGACVGGAQYR